MKKLTFVMMALAMVLTLSQCKKEEQKPANNDGDRIVPITLDVSKQVKADNGSRINVDPNTGDVAFEQNDVVYVGSGGKYVGKLTCRGTSFKGNLTNPAMNEPLYFYFLGNRTPENELTPATSSSCSVNIIDQTDIANMAVISFGVSEEDFTGEGTYHSFFQNKGALVMFDVETYSTEATCIEGMNNHVTINFSDNSFTFDKINNGAIKLSAGSGERWAILLPQNALPAGSEAYSDTYDYTGTCGAVPAITANDYLFEGIDVNVITYGNLPEGAVNGKFTINSDGDQVFFSNGNLQYNPYEGIWRFAENQTDYIGNGNTNIVYGYEYDGWLDLFGWGTSGWNNGNIYYRPFYYEYVDNPSHGFGYGPTDNTNYDYDLTGAYAEADWGVYNAISNGGNQAGLWRTLTQPEWDYVLNTRATPSGIRYAKARVKYVNGVILVPDNWNPSYYTLNSTNTYNANYTTNEITAADWANLQSHGAVFLPAAGLRVGTDYGSYGYDGKYWSATHYSTYYANHLYFHNNGLGITGYYRYEGRSVRLVHDAN